MNTTKTIMATTTTEALLSISPLAVFQDEVEACRKAFLEELQTLPEPLSKVAIKTYLKKLKRGKGLPLLGEYAPWLIADFVGVMDRNTVKELILPWLSVYTYIVFIDNVIDEHSKKNKELLLIAAGILLERGITRMYNLSSNTKALLEAVDKYLTETAVAALSELNKHRLVIKSYSDQEIKALGQKVSALKLCMVYILSSRGVKEVGDTDLMAIDSLSTGIQLLDDITDWEDDWKKGNFTPLLTLTFQRLASNGIDRALTPHKLKSEELLLGMVITKSLEELLEKSIELLQVPLNQRNTTTHSTATEFLQQVIANNMWFKDFIKESRLNIQKQKVLCVNDEDWLSELIMKSDVKRKIYEIRQTFPIVAQQS
jgi:hypothetical protein